MSIRIIIAIIIGLFVFLVAALIFNHTLAALIGLAVGLLYLFGDRPRMT